MGDLLKFPNKQEPVKLTVKQIEDHLKLDSAILVDGYAALDDLMDQINHLEKKLHTTEASYNDNIRELVGLKGGIYNVDMELIEYATCVRISLTESGNAEEYILELIDAPAFEDFTYDK